MPSPEDNEDFLDSSPFVRGLEKLLERVQAENEQLRKELRERENIWLQRLQAADRRAERILRATVNRFTDPPVILVDKLRDDVGLQMEAGGPNIITAGEWPKTERSVIECSKVVYLRDFFRSFWRRLTKR